MDPRSSHNLPEQPDLLLGREQELNAVCGYLLASDVHLLNLTGPPGVGKTRLAMAAAQRVLAEFPDGVWFVDLAPLQDAALVGPEVARIMGVRESRDTTALDSLAAYLRSRRVLLFLDNFEAVLPAATWVGRLLERTSGLKLLMTSRERLRLRWEKTVRVRPLPLPALDPLPDLSALMENPSVTLFVRRAMAVNADFTLSVENAPVIVALCSHLDGLPLAIELAAARAGILSPAEILTHLDNRFRLLRTGARDLPERHQTLKAAIDWSYASLSPVLGRFLRRLSIFAGGFSLTAAELVAECETLGLDGLESLMALTEKSLVNRARDSAGETRFTLLESIREYLLEQLCASGELEHTRRKHAEYYLALAERNYAEMRKAHRTTWLDLLQIEHDNLRAALQWSLDTGEHALGKRIAAALWSPFWWLHGHVHEGGRWLETFLASGAESGGEVQMRLLEGAGTLFGWRRDLESGRRYLTEALQLAQEQAEEAAVVRILGRLSWILWVNGKTEEAAGLAQTMEAGALDGDPWELAYAFLGLGSLVYEAGLDEVAASAFTRACGYFRSAEEKSGAVFAESKLALLQYKQRKLREANQRMVGALEAARQLNERHVMALCADDAAQLLAYQLMEHSMAQGHEPTKVARLWGAVDQWRELLGLPRTPREKSAYLQMTEFVRRQVGEHIYRGAWQEGQSVPLETVSDEAARLLLASDPPRPPKRQPVEADRMSITLSNREHQVLELVAEGLSNQEIAERLVITERTVRFHTTSIFNKLGVNNRTQAVAVANRLGML